MTRPKRNVAKPARWGNQIELDALQTLIQLDEIAPVPAAVAAVGEQEGDAAVNAGAEGGEEMQVERDLSVEVAGTAAKGKRKARDVSEDEDEGAGSSQDSEHDYTPKKDQ